MQGILARLPHKEQDWGMNRSGSWRSRLTGTMLGQLQLATYAAVLLGFTGATSAGLLLSERSRLSVGEAELLAASKSLAGRLNSGDVQGETLIVRELQDHSSVRTNLWVEQPDGTMLAPERDHRPIPVALLQGAIAANPLREPGQSHLIELEGRDFLTLLDSRLASGALLWSSTEISGLGSAQSEFLAWMILIWGSSLSASLLLVSLLVRKITRPLQDLSSRSAELTAESL